jgi:hypothetical protein
VGNHFETLQRRTVGAGSVRRWNPDTVHAPNVAPVSKVRGNRIEDDTGDYLANRRPRSCVRLLIGRDFPTVGSSGIFTCKQRRQELTDAHETAGACGASNIVLRTRFVRLLSR